MTKKKMTIDFKAMRGDSNLMERLNHLDEIFRRIANQTPNPDILELEVDIDRDAGFRGHCQRVLPSWIKIDWD